MGEKWICSNCGTENELRFCTKCGSPKPEAEIPEIELPDAETMKMEIPQSAPESGPWDCPCGQKGNEGKFCRNCGAPREQGFAPTAEPLEEPKKKRSLKPLFFIIGGVVVLAAIIVALVLILGNNKFTTNRKPQAEVLEVKEDFALFVDEEQDISFLYPDELNAESDEYGAFVYDGIEEFTYVMINRFNESVKPKDYFKRVQENLTRSYGNLDFTKMEEVEIEGKTLYVVKTYIPELEKNQDQYLEIYDDCYITYSVIGGGLSTENKILNGVIGSLRTSANAYPMPEALIHENNLGNYSVEVLSDYEVEQIEGGLRANKKKIHLFVRYLNTDYTGALIYGRDDFLDRAERFSTYMASAIGVESADFWDAAEAAERINGKDFTAYDAVIGLEDGSYANGKIIVGDSDNTVGCYILCYYLDDNTGSMQKKEAENFLQSMSVHGDPNIPNLSIKDLREAGFGLVAFTEDLVGTIDIKEDSVVIHDPDNTQTVTFEIREGTNLYEDIAKPTAQDIANQYETAHVAEIDPPVDGRYIYQACEITYTTDKGVNRVYRIYCISSSSDKKFCFYYDVEEGKEDWVKEVTEQICSSWRMM